MRLLGLIGISIILIVTILVITYARQANDQSVSQRFYIEIKNINGSSERYVLKAFEGDSITLAITTDEHGSFHLHGYDLKLEVQPGQETQLQFEADMTGSFSYTFHINNADDHTHLHNGKTEHDVSSREMESPLGRLEVYPR